ncbi:hypothetical protein [Clostridium beijerinckii]|uniref:Uncharacterized protein n=1 Tax=Clostridium beijerinckii TaxID=1520 RepID=A0AAE5LPW4_CLOBE|nr:hypothetical protein [Clostridium beijerinckii]NSB14024.1 hypothetical protein [Clostridium beijerinckii]OOM24530.1 hypothetical protein CLOBE_38340 [Clostridium beijerinckii]
MRLVILNEKAMGKELAVPIYTQSGMIYLNKGAKINERNIEQIKKIENRYKYSLYRRWYK